MIGAVTNRWTMELGQNWRFQFGRAPERKNAIIDTHWKESSTARHYWSLAARDDGLAEEDYILVSRIRNSPTGGLMIVAAGVKQFGTEAAGRLLAEPEQLGAILAKLPGLPQCNEKITAPRRAIPLQAMQTSTRILTSACDFSSTGTG